MSGTGGGGNVDRESLPRLAKLQLTISIHRCTILRSYHGCWSRVLPYHLCSCIRDPWSTYHGYRRSVLIGLLLLKLISSQAGHMLCMLDRS